MNCTHLISVIIPTYNRAHLIKRSVESVLNQTYKNLELIIIDDGSTDNTKEIIDSINDERIVYIKQENQGVSNTRNKGIDLAKGEYIAFQDSDDVWHLDKLEKQFNALKKNNADVVFCKIVVFGNLRKRTIPQEFKEGFLRKDCIPVSIGTQTFFGKAEIFKNNKFDTTIQGIEDFDLLLRIQKNYSIYCLDEGLLDYHLQKDSLSNNNSKRLYDLEKILNRNKNFLKEYSTHSLEFLAECFLCAALGQKDKKERKKALNLIFKISNSKKIKLIYWFNILHIYKIRELMYKSISIPTKKIIMTYKKYFNK